MTITARGIAATIAALTWLTGCVSAPEAEPDPQRYSGLVLQWNEGQSYRADGQEQPWAYGMSPEAMQDLAPAYPQNYAPGSMHTVIAVDVEGVLRPVDPETRRYGCVGGCYDHYLAITRVHSARLLRSACRPIETRVFFATNETGLDAAALARIGEAVGEVERQACNVSRISIVGHADTVGPAARNLALSEARAGAVREALEARGMDASWMTTEGAGEERSLRLTADNVAEPVNRVVEVLIEAPTSETP
jgi:outer membrane protein OmpA-like peptidoglycan-associated protein